MDASKVTIDGKTLDMNYLGKKKRTNLRRKLIIEHIQSKPAGEIISMSEFQAVGRFNNYATTWSFVQSMIKQGVIGQYAGDKPRTYYYSVIGAVRVRTPAKVEPAQEPLQSTAPQSRTPDLNAFVADMVALGVQFTITISSKDSDA